MRATHPRAPLFLVGLLLACACRREASVDADVQRLAATGLVLDGASITSTKVSLDSPALPTLAAEVSGLSGVQAVLVSLAQARFVERITSERLPRACSSRLPGSQGSEPAVAADLDAFGAHVTPSDGQLTVTFTFAALQAESRGEGCAPCDRPCRGCGASKAPCSRFARAVTLEVTDVITHSGRVSSERSVHGESPWVETAGAEPRAQLGDLPARWPGIDTVPTVVRGKVQVGAIEVGAPELKPRLEAYVTARRGALQSCYERELKRNPTLKGKLVVRFVIVPQGRTSDIDIEENTLGNDVVPACVRTVVRSWVFPFKPEEDVPIALAFLMVPSRR